MSSGLMQNLYWISPYWIKVGMAWLHTSRLTVQRYGQTYEQIVKVIKQRNSWTIDQWKAYQQETLRELVLHAYQNVPYYQETFRNNDLKPEMIRSIEDIQKIPILDKQAVRNNPESFVDERQNKSCLIKADTSGTTGTPLRLYQRKHEASAATAFFDVRCHEVVGMTRIRNRSASIGAHLVASYDRTKPPFWVYNPRWNQLYMSSYHLAEKYLGSYVEKLRKFRPDYIEGYPSTIYAIARHIVDNGLDPVRCKACFTTAETLFDYHRKAIQKAFGCRTYNQYGCNEMAVFAAECEQGSMHISPDYCIVEVVDDNNRPLPAGEIGHFVCTSLVNWTQPFIRYRLGDIGSLSDQTCSCGSSMPILASIEGRDDAVLTTRDGRRIGRLDPVFKGVHGVSASQIIQNDYDRFVVRIIPASDYTERDQQRIIDNLRDRLGKARIEIECVKEIKRTARGKFKAIVNNMADKIKKDVQGNA